VTEVAVNKIKKTRTRRIQSMANKINKLEPDNKHETIKISRNQILRNLDKAKKILIKDKNTIDKSNDKGRYNNL